MYDWRPGPISHCQPAEVQIGVSFGYFRNHLKQVIYKKKERRCTFRCKQTSKGSYNKHVHLLTYRLSHTQVMLLGFQKIMQKNLKNKRVLNNCR